MLDFKTANATAIATASGHSTTAYKTVPEYSTTAVTSGLNRLFGTSSRTLSRDSSLSSVSEQQEWEVSTAEQRCKARKLDGIH